jgi:arylsulfatase A
MTTFVRSTLLIASCLPNLASLCSAADASSKPNVVLILADDLGWTDLGCYGSDLYRTPHIDRLARDGVRFTQHYSACTVCSPTRAALLTGKYPARLHITDWIPGQPPENPKLIVPDWTKFLPHEETTIAEVFKSAGYATASIGKWHLGMESHYPQTHGFDINIAGTDKPQPPSYFAPWKIATLSEGKEGDYITDRLADEAAKFITAHRDQPFFLYCPHFAVHTPIQGKPDLVAKYQAIPHGELKQNNAAYAAMVESLDDAVGRIRQTLDELKLAERTVVIFTSDNGGRVPTTSNLPLRVGKGSCYEGGTRVPLIVHWPGVTRPGSVSESLAITMDVYPTLLEIAGLKGAAGHRPDGVSLVPVLRGDGTLRRDTLFWHYPHYQHYQLGGTTPYGAIRSGDFKLIEFFTDMRVELYNLREDIGEAHDLAARMPEKVNELRNRLHAWRKEVGAQMPTPNPNHDPSRPEHTPPQAKAKKKT